jgi:hypothetical protein
MNVVKIVFPVILTSNGVMMTTIVPRIATTKSEIFLLSLNLGKRLILSLGSKPKSASCNKNAIEKNTTEKTILHMKVAMQKKTMTAPIPELSTDRSIMRV